MEVIMKKNILMLLLLLVIVFSLVGCAECISTEYENVEVKIVDEYYSPTWYQPVFTGKSTALITHPATYRITIEYNGVEYTFSDSDTYDRYKDKVGQTTIGALEIRNYDDGTIRYDIISLE